MKLLLLSRRVVTFSEWSDHLTPLSASGWQVVFAAHTWKSTRETAELRAQILADTAWSVTSAPLVSSKYPGLAERTASLKASAGILAYTSLTAASEPNHMLEEVQPDAVALLSDTKALKYFGPLIAAAAARGLPTVLLNNWEQISEEHALHLFSDIATPDASCLVDHYDARIHSVGPLVRFAADPCEALGARAKLLAQIGLNPQKPYILHLRGDSPATNSQMDPLVSVLESAAAAGLQVAVLPSPLSGKVSSQSPEIAPTTDWRLVTQGETRNSTASTKRFYRTLATGAHLITGEATPLILDAAAAGAAVAALPVARPYIIQAAQGERFGPRLLKRPADLHGLISEPRPTQAIKTTIDLATVLSSAKARPTSHKLKIAQLLGQSLMPARSKSTIPLPVPLPAVTRTLTPGNINLDNAELTDILQILAVGDAPILVGPWISEVGFEVLYWIPFVRWCVRRFGIDPARLTVCSRGGVIGWYADLQPARYLDIFDLIDESEFRRRTFERFAESGGQKHLQLTALDDLIATEVRLSTQSKQLSWLHPQLMYRFFRSYWLGRQSRQFFDHHTLPAHFSSKPLKALAGKLPDQYIAMRFYFRPSFPDTIENRNLTTRTIERMATASPVVLIETGLSLDDHVEFAPNIKGNIHRIGHLVTGRNNLALQSEVIRKARLFVGTYGGLSYIPPFYRVPSIAVSTDISGFLSTHLETAIRTFQALGTSFSHIDAQDLQILMR